MNNVYSIRLAIGSESEAKTVAEAWKGLVDTYLAGTHRRKIEKIDHAFSLALRAHRGMRRPNGEPYILHPLAVAKIAAAELGLGSTSICAALLHDVPEHTDFTKADIQAVCGPYIADMVDAITRISGGLLTGSDISSSGDYRSLLLSLREDIRVVLVKMAERLSNMRDLGWERPEKQIRTARETLFVYAPLAERLGLFKMKSELENLAFSFLYPEENRRIHEALDRTALSRERITEDFLAPVELRLRQLGFSFETKARVKSAYSIFNKMRKKGIPLEEIYDIYAVRVIFDCEDAGREAEMCHKIATCFTDIYSTHPERLRDWTHLPKSNGYRALHITCLGPHGDWIEVQIRSTRMDRIAELGCAAHWQYKTDDSVKPLVEADIETIRNVLAAPDSLGMDTLNDIRLGLNSADIFLITEKGIPVRLAAESTAEDMARLLHPGKKCLAAKVNGTLVLPSHTLRSGDKVELIISRSNREHAI